MNCRSLRKLAPHGANMSAFVPSVATEVHHG